MSPEILLQIIHDQQLRINQLIAEIQRLQAEKASPEAT